MGFVDYQNAQINSAPSPVESSRFGYATDRINVGALVQSTNSLAASVQATIEASNATIKIVRYPSELVSLFRDLHLEGTHLYPGGSLLYWESPPLSLVSDEGDEGTREVPAAHRNDFAAVIAKVLEDSFAGYINHYSANPLIPHGAVVDGYLEWAQRTMADPANRVFVAMSDRDDVVGVAVIAVAGRVWEIELASISTAAQRQGKYLTLIGRVLASAKMEGAERVVISTQSHNIGVQRAWSRLGFRPLASIDTVHLVTDPPLGLTDGSRSG